MNNNITMLDFVNYMEGFAEGKNDFDETEISERQGPRKTSQKTAKKPTIAIRRKKEIVKSRARLNVLKNIADYEPSDPAIHGIVRNHQVQLVKPGNNLGNSRANRRRTDSYQSKSKLEEFAIT